MKDKEKQIEEINNFIETACDYKNRKQCRRFTTCNKCRATVIYEQGYRKLSKDSVVLSKSEKQKLLKEMYEQGKFDALADLEKDGKVVLTREELEEKYEPSETFMPVARELEDLKQSLKDKIVLTREEFEKKEKQIKDLKYALKVHAERLDHFYNLNEDVYYYEEKQAEAVKQARKETAEKIFVEVLDLEQLKVIRDMGWETIYNSLYNEILELTKQFGVEIGGKQ